MKNLKQKSIELFLKTPLGRWWVEETGVAFIETVILFPVLVSLLMGVYDLGQGIVVNQKTMSASQILGDLITRNEAVDMDLITDIVNAGELALEPYSTDSFGYDIASVQFDEDGDPVVLWRVTENMEPNEGAVDSTVGLGTEGQGIVVVSTSYTYVPYFANFVVDQINMSEVAFLRARTASVVTCADCP